MNAPLLPEIFLGIDSTREPQLPLASEGVQRYVWEGRFGAMLIEVKDGAVFVNGQQVEPHATGDQRATKTASVDKPSSRDGLRVTQVECRLREVLRVLPQPRSAQD